MKRILKRVLIVIAIIAIAVLIFAVGMYFKFKSESKGMTPIATKEVVANVFAINDSFVNMFIVKDSDQYIAIDAGNDAGVIAAGLKTLKIDPDKVVAVLLTHTDRDHVAALGLFKNAKVYLSRSEEQMLTGEKKKFFMRNKISTDKYTLIDDLQTLLFGDISVKGYLTPGHTSGSMCYLVNEKYLFTGDVLSLKAGKIGKFNKFFNMDDETANKSIANITKIESAEYIFTAHYGFTADYKNAVKDWK